MVLMDAPCHLAVLSSTDSTGFLCTYFAGFLFANFIFSLTPCFNCPSLLWSLGSALVPSPFVPAGGIFGLVEPLDWTLLCDFTVQQLQSGQLAHYEGIKLYTVTCTQAHTSFLPFPSFRGHLQGSSVLLCGRFAFAPPV